MNTQTRRIAGFMSAESIYSLAFYVVMVAAIAGVGAGVMVKKDSAKAAAAISLLRANYMAEGATLGYTPPGTAADVVRLSGNLLQLAGAVPDAVLPGDSAIVTLLPKTGGTAPTGFIIHVTGITKPDICSAVAGVGFGTWEGMATSSVTAGSTVGQATGQALRTACTGAGPTAAAVTLAFISN